MPITVTCPSCREALEIPNELLGGEVRCGSCMEVFVALTAEGGNLPPVVEPTSRPRRKKTEPTRDKPVPVSRPDDGYGPVDFDPERKSRQGLGAAFGIIVLVFGLLGCGCCGVFGWFIFQTMDPDYKEYRDPQGRFVAVFPAEVRQTQCKTGRGDETAQCVEAERRLIRERYFIYWVELTPAEKRDRAKVVDKLCDGLIENNGGTQISRTKRAHQGYDAAEIIIRDRGKRFTEARVIVAEDRGYVVGVSVNGEPQTMIWLEEFFESFEILDGHGGDPAPVEEKKNEPNDGQKKPQPNDD